MRRQRRTMDPNAYAPQGYGDGGEQLPYAPGPYGEPYAGEAPYAGQEPYGEEPYAEEEPAPPEPVVIATNGTVKLTCTLAAFCPLLALFLFFADKRSRAIRYVAVQSLGISAAHLLAGAALLLLGALLGAIPFLGYLMVLVCWLLYAAVAAGCVYFRVRLMLAAYAGLRYTLPVLGERLEVFAARP